MTETPTPSKHSSSADSQQLHGIDHIEVYTGNARQAAQFYRNAFGFSIGGHLGFETGFPDRESFLMTRKDINLVLTSPIYPESEIAEHIHVHGDGVKDIAFAVSDVEKCFHEAVKRGASPVLEPAVIEYENGRFSKATIAAFGDTVHSLVRREGVGVPFVPGCERLDPRPPASSPDFTATDHVAICVEAGKLDRWVAFYGEVLGFHLSYQEDIMTEMSGMNSKVVQNRTGTIKFPILEPAPGRKKSQIEEYLGYYRGAGVQHIALLSSDILKSVSELRANQVEFLPTPGAYYDTLRERLGPIDEDVDALRKLNVLADRDEWGYLMQIFTRPVQSRPTFFFEVIERKGARGFGAGNIRALFEANEREQAARGNL